MKKIILAAAIMMFSMSYSFAQTTAKQVKPVATKSMAKAPNTAVAVQPSVAKTSVTTTTKKPTKTSVKAVAATSARPLKSDGTPDKRYKVNAGIKKDGTPDKRFKANKKP